MEISIVVAADLKGGIGYKNRMPWNIKSELEWFRALTTSGKSNAVIMGSNTWNHCLSREVLKKRLNIVLSKNLLHCDEWPFDLIYSKSFDEALKICEDMKISNVWIIGGEQIYRQALESLVIKRIYLSRVRRLYTQCDVFFPSFDMNKFKLLVPHEQNLEIKIPQDYSSCWSLEVYENLLS